MHSFPDEAQEALTIAAAALGCQPAILAAILEVESGGYSGAARLKARRFEPHVFRRLGGGMAASFEGAARIDPHLAEEASSHGAPQIMGFNAHMLGYRSPVAMRAAFLSGGWPEQIDALRRYAVATGLASPLRALNIREIARIYNGPAYEKLGYHLKLSAAYARLSGRPAARVLRRGDQGEAVLRLQQDLIGAGHTVDPDGAFGPDTETAVKRFQAKQGLVVDGIVGALTWAALGLSDAAEAVEPPPTRVEIEADRAFRHRGKLGALLAALATFREEVAAWGLDAAALARRGGAALTGLSVEQWALVLLATVVLWPRISPHLRRVVRL